MRFHLTWSCLIWCMFLSVFVSVGNGQIVESCDSVIFCEGRILDTVARAHIFNDSIEFVKMSLKFDAEVVIEHFDDLPGAPGNISKETLRKFVDDNFEEPSQAFEDWNPSDWVEK
ncbi:unnamed protein product [Cyprideis torosa]|uniref:Trehalase n=1 Tax=Cyprideis torosa TaxID=163714 RepID=A0A7R8WUE1_9CRUS|nr:unnamed protein product [Cyprideis torosa]CAG0909517.1 unnamed protein product [Cyprideis torosa]